MIWITVESHWLAIQSSKTSVHFYGIGDYYFIVQSIAVITFKPYVESPWLNPRGFWRPSGDPGNPVWFLWGQGSRTVDKHSLWRLAVRNREEKKNQNWGRVGALGARQEPDPRPECFAASQRHQCASQWAQGKTNYQRNDWRVRRASHSQPPPDGHN